jgi:hypothetical protein
MTMPWNHQDYLQALERLEAIVRAEVAGGGAVSFAMPPKDILLVADLGQVGARLARSDGARRIIALACRGPRSQTPTAFMLRVVLERLRIEVAEVSLSELGLSVSGVS